MESLVAGALRVKEVKSRKTKTSTGTKFREFRGYIEIAGPYKDGSRKDVEVPFIYEVFSEKTIEFIENYFTEGNTFFYNGELATVPTLDKTEELGVILKRVNFGMPKEDNKGKSKKGRNSRDDDDDDDDRPRKPKRNSRRDDDDDDDDDRPPKKRRSSRDDDDDDDTPPKRRRQSRTSDDDDDEDDKPPKKRRTTDIDEDDDDDDDRPPRKKRNAPTDEDDDEEFPF